MNYPILMFFKGFPTFDLSSFSSIKLIIYLNNKKVNGTVILLKLFIYVNLNLCMGKRKFLLDFGTEKVEVEGYDPQKALIKYLMKKRRSLLMTKDKEKVERLWKSVPSEATVSSARSVKKYRINWKEKGEGEFEGARYVFYLEEEA